ncbi:hypothetical protein CHS0354_018528 [Potamilus streckersoni]|uniref:GTP cyclohydrolase II domain-containing protein n=1 Tax=Potamilus streckersoni TaxID=2493646 RepID=A0AAE0WAZ4_9BIVA|nr:hypothetical protein CHS0354_018528 [Potamilus streckersoni]
MNDDGTMARYAELKAFSRKHNLKMVTIKDLIEYRLNKEKQELYLAFVSGDPAQDDPASVRVHSAYPPSDLLTEIMQGESLVTKGLKYIQAHPPGIFLYVMKEVTSAQTAAKIESLLAPQSVKAEQSAPPEERMLREYGFGAQVIRDLGFRKLQVLTSHPRQIIGLDAYGLEVCKTIPM